MALTGRQLVCSASAHSRCSNRVDDARAFCSGAARNLSSAVSIALTSIFFRAFLTVTINIYSLLNELVALDTVGRSVEYSIATNHSSTFPTDPLYYVTIIHLFITAHYVLLLPTVISDFLLLKSQV